MTETQSKPLSSVTAHLRDLKVQLFVRNCKAKYPENFSLEEFLLKLEVETKEVSQISTQIAIAHRKSSGSLKEIHELIYVIEAASENLVLLFHSLPLHYGKRYCIDIAKMIRNIFIALIDFIQSLSKKETQSAREILKYAEYVYLKCKDVQKIPKNNVESVLRVFYKEELSLLNALQEIGEEVRSNFSGLKYGEEIDNTKMWNNQDRELLPPCVALVETTRVCLKKVISAVKAKGDCTDPKNSSQLDELAYMVEDLTVNVDNFVTTIYPPMNQKDVKQGALKVVSTIHNLLSEVQNSHFIEEVDQSWIMALFKSIDHNNNKLQPLFSDEKFYETNETSDSDEYEGAKN